jgi:hypothetical protein
MSAQGQADHHYHGIEHELLTPVRQTASAKTMHRRSSLKSSGRLRNRINEAGCGKKVPEANGKRIT